MIAAFRQPQRLIEPEFRHASFRRCASRRHYAAIDTPRRHADLR
jgi:hypothetical protein